MKDKEKCHIRRWFSKDEQYTVHEHFKVLIEREKKHSKDDAYIICVCVEHMFVHTYVHACVVSMQMRTMCDIRRVVCQLTMIINMTGSSFLEVFILCQVFSICHVFCLFVCFPGFKSALLIAVL